MDFRCSCNLLVQNEVSRVMETRNDNLVQSNGNVYERLRELVMENQKVLDAIKVSVLQMRLLRLFLEKMDNIRTVDDAKRVVIELLTSKLFEED